MANIFVVAQHASEGRLILTVCDGNVHGKRFEDANAVLDLSSKFYSGGEKNAEETARLMEKAYVINAAGKESVKIVIKAGLAEKEAVKTIKGVPHVQVLMSG